MPEGRSSAAVLRLQLLLFLLERGGSQLVWSWPADDGHCVGYLATAVAALAVI
jgi:hypothetical protein